MLVLQMVNRNEMPDVMRVIKETAHLKPKQWVRLKRGLYKDDLAQVRKQIRPLQEAIKLNS